MFKLQYYSLILTFSRVYKNKKKQYENYWGGSVVLEQGRRCPFAHPVATALTLALRILHRRGGISPLDNEDEPIF